MRNVGHRVMRLSIFYKILVANTVIMVAGAVGGTWLTGQLVVRSFPDELIVIFVLLGLVLTISVNFLILKAALRPLANLQKTVEAVRRGNITARVEEAVLGDPLVTHLGDALNSMLDELSDSRNRLEVLSGKVLGAQEDERKRVARELHDETSQALTSLMIEMKMLEKLDPEERRKKIADLWDYTSQILDGVHRLTRELRPRDLDELGLVPALRSYIKESAKRFDIGIDLEVTGLRGRLPDNVEVALYRVVQEALTNAAKHSEAGSVRVAIRREDDLVVVAIKDDGRGFDLGEVKNLKEQGLGLFGMRERMSIVGGELEISSSPGQGTEVVARIPWKENDGG